MAMLALYDNLVDVAGWYRRRKSDMPPSYSWMCVDCISVYDTVQDSHNDGQFVTLVVTRGVYVSTRIRKIPVPELGVFLRCLAIFSDF